MKRSTRLCACPHCRQTFKAVPVSAPAATTSKSSSDSSATAKSKPVPSTTDKTAVSTLRVAKPSPATKPPEEIEVNEAVAEEVSVDEAVDEEEVAVDEAADEVEVNEASDDERSPLLKDDPFEGEELSTEFIKEIKSELTKSEKIVWVGRASKGVKKAEAKKAVVIGIVITIIGVGILCGSVPVVIKVSIGLFIGMFLFGLIFTALGILAIFAPKLMAKAMPYQAVYVLTNRRALAWQSAQSGAANPMRSYNALKVANMERKNSKMVPGAGDLIFEYELSKQDSGGRGTVQKLTKIPFGFLGVDRVHEVEHLVRTTLIYERNDRLLS